MFLDLHTLPQHLDLLEKIEKASMRLVTQEISDFAPMMTYRC